MAEAKVIKKPSKETKVVEVELTREELIIEKRSVEKEADKSPIAPTIPPASSSSQEITQYKTEIKIPLMREGVVVLKRPYVKQEIIIRKNSVTEIEKITGQVTSEK